LWRLKKKNSTAKKRDIAPFKVNGQSHIIINFFPHISYEVVPRDFNTHVKLIYFSQFYRQYENRDIYVEHSEMFANSFFPQLL
jgi:hypothetical protein